MSGNEDYEVYRFRRPGKASLSYGLIFGNEMFVFDPAKNISAYQQFAEKHGCAITRTFETHRQADYISGSDPLRKQTGAEIIASPRVDKQGKKDVELFIYRALNIHKGGVPDEKV